MKTALFPGCSLEGSASGFLESFSAVMEALGVDVPELADWNCCGATSAHALDHRLHLSLNLRNLALAEQQGFEEILAPCAACYHRLVTTAFELKENAAARDQLNDEAGLEYSGGVRVRKARDYLVNVVGMDRVAERVVEPLTGLRVASYYGCLNTRVPRMACFDDRENPTSMDAVVSALGGEAVEWSYKTECCGASLFLTDESVCAKLTARILKDAVARESDCIAVACPMCQNNLDTKQGSVRREFRIAKPMPVLFITQLMGLAFGIDQRQLGLKQSFVPFAYATGK